MRENWICGLFRENRLVACDIYHILTAATHAEHCIDIVLGAAMDIYVRLVEGECGVEEVGNYDIYVFVRKTSDTYSEAFLKSFG